MTITEQENTVLINHFETLKREIALENADQLVTIARVIGRDADLIIEKFRLLNKYEKEALERGKVLAGVAEEVTGNHLQLSRHKAMHMRLIPD